MMNGATVIACVLLPFAILLWPRWPRKPKSILLRWALVTLLGWIVMVIAGQVYGYLWGREMRITGNVPEWDPAFTIAATLVFGWMFPLLASLPFIAIRECLAFVERRQASRIRKNNPAEQAVGLDAG